MLKIFHCINLQYLKAAVDLSEKELKSAESIINLIRNNLEFDCVDTTNYQIHTINNVVDRTLKNYHFKNDDDKKLVHWKSSVNFEFYGSNTYLSDVIKNLLANSFYYIQKLGGKVNIWIDHEGNFNTLHFEDSAKGVSSEVLAHMFEPYYSTRKNGAGLGLAFCKTIMKSFGGDIIAKSVEGKFLELILKFPKIA